MIHHNIYKVPKFLEHKKNLIDLIYKIPINPLETKGEKISHQDFNLPKNVKRDYLNYFRENIFEGFAKNFCDFLTLDKIHVSELWFQVYEKGDFHEFHTHMKTNFTNVFYINLPHKETKTQFKLKNENFSIFVEEGDILSFPGYYPHSSPKNNYKDKKIIIAFNMDCLYGKEYNELNIKRS